MQPTLWNASLSTMWAKDRYSNLEDFFLAAREMGFASIELNHQIDSQQLAGISLGKYAFSSVHEPCPADISTALLRKEDWLISSEDEDRRRIGVYTVRRSIDLAAAVGARAVVVHCGNVQDAPGLERQMRQMIRDGQRGSDAYSDILDQFLRQRAAQVGPRMEAVTKSLKELLAYARPRGVRLGLENRFHIMDIPSVPELKDLLSLAAPEALGFILDVGHARALDVLGMHPFQAWLDAFSTRIVGTHLHDVIGVDDHHAPGLGEIDYAPVAACLPAEAFRTFELRSHNTPAQVKAGLQHLVDRGCVAPI
jgi:sugar phosphate isomerase/epimerase